MLDKDHQKIDKFARPLSAVSAPLRDAPPISVLSERLRELQQAGLFAAANAVEREIQFKQGKR